MPMLRSRDLMIPATPAGGASAVGGQPGVEVAGALEIKQVLGQQFMLLQPQGLGAGNGEFAQRAAETGEISMLK